jgi:hypothetical protein
MKVQESYPYQTKEWPWEKDKRCSGGSRIGALGRSLGTI